jgi:hypothetical protein
MKLDVIFWLPVSPGNYCISDTAIDLHGWPTNKILCYRLQNYNVKD